jgi:hypothetical protein
LHTRDDLLSFIEDRVNRRGMVRALTNGDVEVLGGFSSIPPRNLPGWIVKADTGLRAYHLAVTVEQGGVHRVWNLVGGVPWESWVGDNEAFKNNRLTTGDHPDLYIERRNDARTTSEKGKEESARRLADG